MPMLVHCGMWFIKLKGFYKKDPHEFFGFGHVKTLFFFSFKITSVMVEWITLIQKQSKCGSFIVHFVYFKLILLKELYSKFTFFLIF